MRSPAETPDVPNQLTSARKSIYEIQTRAKVLMKDVTVRATPHFKAL